jgi:hypothetical protein
VTDPSTPPPTAAELRRQAQQRALLTEQVQALLAALHTTITALPARLAAAPWGTDALTRAVDDLAEAAAAGGLDDADGLAAVLEQLQHVDAAVAAAEQLGAQAASLGASGTVTAFHPDGRGGEAGGMDSPDNLDAPTEPAPTEPADSPAAEPAGSRLIRDDPAWRYQGLHGTVAARRLRVWQTTDGALVAVLTEGPGAEGTSLANAAEHVVTQLQAEYGPDVEVIEHQLPWQPAQPDDPGERWTLTGLTVGTGDTAPDGVEYIELGPVPHVIPGGLERVLLDVRGQATWWPITSADLARRLAGGPWWDPEPR